MKKYGGKVKDVHLRDDYAIVEFEDPKGRKLFDNS